MLYTVGPGCPLTHMVAAVWSLEPFLHGHVVRKYPPHHVLSKDTDSEEANVLPGEATRSGWGRPFRKGASPRIRYLFTLLDAIRPY